MNRTGPYSPEVRARAVRMVRDHQAEHTSQWSAIHSIAEKIGCSGETLRHWVRRAEHGQGLRSGATWVDWFNNRRLLEPIGNLPPAEAEAAYYAQLEMTGIAA